MHSGTHYFMLELNINTSTVEKWNKVWKCIYTHLRGDHNFGCAENLVKMFQE